jgi:hypothetical protein
MAAEHEDRLRDVLHWCARGSRYRTCHMTYGRGGIPVPGLSYRTFAESFAQSALDAVG